MCAFGVEVGILRRLHCAPHCVRAEGKEATARREEVGRASHPRRSLVSGYSVLRSLVDCWRDEVGGCSAPAQMYGRESPELICFFSQHISSLS